MVATSYWNGVLDKLEGDVETLNDLFNDYLDKQNKVQQEFEEAENDEEFLNLARLIIDGIAIRCEEIKKELKI